MERSAWLNKLEDLHVRHRQGECLSEADAGWYRESRDRLLRAALREQNARVGSSERTRQWLRGDRSIEVDLEAPGWACSASTIDVGAGGFASLLSAPPPEGARIRATLLIPGRPPITEPVRMVDARRQHELVRVAFAFESLAPKVRDHIEAYLLDAVLQQLTFWDDVLESMRIR